jgi:hypothetical protein
VRDDKFSGRVDANSRLGLLTGYDFFDDYNLDNPYPGQQGGANIPGFDALTLGRAQLFSFGDNTVFDANTVNEFHIGFTRNANDVGRPNGGLGLSLASQGFVTGPGTPGIVVLAPQLEGVENIAFDTFTMGVTVTGVNQTNSTLNISDNLSRVIGPHTLKVGGQFQFRSGWSRMPPSTAHSRSPGLRPARISPIFSSASRAITSSPRAASSTSGTNTRGCLHRTAGGPGRT